MKTTRFSRSFSRLFLLPTAIFVSVGVAACSADRGQAPDSEGAAAPAEQAQVAPAEPAEAAPADQDEALSADRDRPDSARALPWLRHVEKLDLRPEQRTMLEGIADDLRADLQPSRNEMKKLADIYASGVEAGKIDRPAVDAQRAVLAATAPAVKEALENAANGVHDALDEDQRAELIAMMRARRAERGDWHERGDRHEHDQKVERDDAQEQAGKSEGRTHRRRHGIGKLADELGLTDDQQRTIRDAVREGIDNLFPYHAERREEMAARLTAMEDAFLTDDFDAADFDIGKDMQEMLKGAGDGATGLADLAVRVLTEKQRVKIAEKIRTRTAKL